MTNSPSQNISEILIEALPYIKHFNNKTIVIKFGGSAMSDETLKYNFAKDIVLLKLVGMNPIVVHGGGPQIGSYLKKLNIPIKFVDGIRITDEATMDIVEMVLAGKVNKNIVALINKEGGKAIGLSGKDANLIRAEKMLLTKKETEENTPPEIIDVGLAGKITKINTEILDYLKEKEFIPVISPVGYGKNGETFNINADIVAAGIARALKAYRAIFLTDTPGVLDKEKKLIRQLKIEQIDELIADGTIVGGMIPKILSCKKLIETGVQKVHILDGRIAHSVLLELFTDTGIGTVIFN